MGGINQVVSEHFILDDDARRRKNESKDSSKIHERRIMIPSVYIQREVVRGRDCDEPVMGVMDGRRR